MQHVSKPSPDIRLRLDQLLVERGHYASRSRARDAILRGCVALEGKTISKPGLSVDPDCSVTVDDDGISLVSRAGMKLSHALDATDISVHDRICLDIGASTGGFTQVLLENGAKKVFAIDVGHGQMDERISNDKRVANLEGINARDLDAGLFGDAKIDCIVSDVSFISLRLALPPALTLAATGSVGVFLIKPQFEVGRENIGKGGLVKDAALAEACAGDLFNWLSDQPGWLGRDLIASPIEGGDGNREFIMTGTKND